MKSLLTIWGAKKSFLLDTQEWASVAVIHEDLHICQILNDCGHEVLFKRLSKSDQALVTSGLIRSVAAARHEFWRQLNLEWRAA